MYCFIVVSFFGVVDIIIQIFSASFIYFSFDYAGSLLLRADFSLVAQSGCYFLVVVCGLLMAVTSLVVEQGPRTW